MKRLAVLIAIAASIATANAQSTSVNMSSHDNVSWALIRAGNGGKASVGDMQGVHIGEVTRDEFIYVKEGKGFLITDAKTLADLEATRQPVDKFREVRTKAKTDSREIRGQQRSAERELQSLDRQRSRLDRESTRADANEKRQIAEELRDMATRQTALTQKRDEAAKRLDAANKTVDELEKQMNVLREQAQKKIEQIFDAAKAKGLAKPLN
jgi:hypothetical protein